MFQRWAVCPSLGGHLTTIVMSNYTLSFFLRTVFLCTVWLRTVWLPVRTSADSISSPDVQHAHSGSLLRTSGRCSDIAVGAMSTSGTATVKAAVSGSEACSTCFRELRVIQIELAPIFATTRAQWNTASAKGLSLSRGMSTALLQTLHRVSNTS